jgi:hypothetical protein
LLDEAAARNLIHEQNPLNMKLSFAKKYGADIVDEVNTLYLPARCGLGETIIYRPGDPEPEGERVDVPGSFSFVNEGGETNLMITIADVDVAQRLADANTRPLAQLGERADDA